MPPPPTTGMDLAQAIQEAAALYRQGQLDAAEKICLRLLKLYPNLFDALHLLALVKFQSGKAGAAVTHL
jgi:tetratricopeptide (TPR) repeat protein